MDELARELASAREAVVPPWDPARSERTYQGIVRTRRRRRVRNLGASVIVTLLAAGGWAYLRVPGLNTHAAASVASASHAHVNDSTPADRVAGSLALPDATADANDREVSQRNPSRVAATAARPKHAVAPMLAQREPLGAAARVRLADDSVAEVTSPDGELFVDSNQPEHVRLRLTRGAAHFDVVPNTQRHFEVSADLVEVIVVGTAFEVERSGDRVRVAVEHGVVRVRNPGSEVFVQAGESRWFEQHPAPSVNPAAVGGGRASVANHATRPSGRGSNAAASARQHEAAQESVADDDWRSVNQSGDYRRAYKLIERGAAVDDAVEALMEAADAARLSGHPEAAAGYLAKVLENHRASPATPLAAFMLGRVLLEHLGRPSEAAAAFSTARQLTPSGTLAQDALAREVEAWSKAGQALKAHQRAELFSDRYPESRRLRVVQVYGGLRAP